MHLPIRRGLAALVLTCCTVPAAFAQAAGHSTTSLGLEGMWSSGADAPVLGGSLEVGNTAAVTPTWEYFVRENLGLELALPLGGRRDLEWEGEQVGSFIAVPPTFTVQYHFNGSGDVSPFVGLGLNYTTFLDEQNEGALSGTDLSLRDSYGLTAHTGIDFALGSRGAVRVDVRWIDMGPDLELLGHKAGRAQVDPLFFGVSYLWYF